MSDEPSKPDGKDGWFIYVVGLGIGALLGSVVGYFVGVALGCYVLMPHSNLCGIVGVFITGPIGLVVGTLIAAWRMR
jgi:hypothetical protein